MDAAPCIRLADPCLVVLVGAAGAGKSTFAARHFAPDEVLSSDAFRELVGGDATDQRWTRPAFAALHRALRGRLRARRLTLVDATNVTPAARLALVREARAAGLPAVAVVLDLPPGLVLARNAARPDRRAIPEHAVRRHLAAVARTVGAGQLAAEGFAAVWRLDDPRDLDAVRVVRSSAAPPAPRRAATG